MKNKLQTAIFESAKKLWPQIQITKEEIEISYPPENFGDYSTNIALKLASKVKLSPMVVADMFLNDLNKSINDIGTVKIIKPGFVNFKLSEDVLRDTVAKINKEGDLFGTLNIGDGIKIQVEFISANPTGPIHLGNGRGGPMGDVLVNVLKKAGFDAKSEYYINDFGNQVKILGHSVLKDEEAQYSGSYINRLHEKLGNKNGDPFEVGQKAAAEIMKETVKPSMEKLGIEFDEYFSEKSLHASGEVDEVIDELKKKDLVYKKNGAWWFKATKYGDDKDRVVKKTSGELTYFGSDIAYHKNKFERGFDKVINIWGSDHHGDVARVKGAVEALGYGGKLEIILTQFVRVIKDGKEFKMSKRDGTYVSVRGLLDEVGKDAFRFFFLMHSPDTHMDFDIDLAKEQSDKNPIFYVQYAHARMNGILEKQKEIKLSGEKKIELLEHEKEFELIRKLLKFPELVEDIVQSYEVHQLPYYSIKLADLFHSFYHECKVLDEKNLSRSLARIELVKATKIVLAETLRLMGVGAPNKM